VRDLAACLSTWIRLTERERAEEDASAVITRLERRGHAADLLADSAEQGVDHLADEFGVRFGQRVDIDTSAWTLLVPVVGDPASAQSSARWGLPLFEATRALDTSKSAS
jgi:hypothetical protein